MEKSRNVHRTDTMVTNVNRNEHLEMDFNFLKSEIYLEKGKQNKVLNNTVMFDPL
jgi:hypothetical protein